MKQTTSYAQWYVGATARVAKQAFDALLATGGAPHYLYYKPNGLEFRVVRDGDDTPDGFVLATGERIPSDLAFDQLTQWVCRFTRDVPVLPED